MIKHKLKRPVLLPWLCLSSALFGIAWIIMFAVLIILTLQGNSTAGLFPGIVIRYLSAGYGFIIIEILLTATGLAAIVMMWNLKKAGFYIYATSKIALYFLPVLFLGTSQLTYLPLVVTSVFIVSYGAVLRIFEKSN